MPFHGGQWAGRHLIRCSHVSFAGLYGHSIDVDGDLAVIGSRADLHLPPYSEVPPLFDVLDPHIGAYFAFSDQPWGAIPGIILLPNDVTWIDLPPDGEFDASPLGRVVAIEDDSLVIGDPWAAGEGGSSGRAFVYGRTGSAWDVQAELTSSVGAIGRFDQIEILGTTIAATMGGQPAVVVWDQSAGTWLETAAFDLAGPTVTELGGIALQDDRLVVGLPSEQRVTILARSGAGWANRSQLEADTVGFGQHLAVDGRRVAVASLAAVQIFVRRQGRWESEFRLDLGSDTVASISLSGARLAVSIDGAEPRTLLFRRSQGSWTDWFETPGAGMVRVEGVRMLLRDPRDNQEFFWPDYDRGTARSFVLSQAGRTETYGTNPRGSLEVFTSAALGDDLGFLVDDPSQSFGFPAQTFVLISAGPAPTSLRPEKRSAER